MKGSLIGGGMLAAAAFLARGSISLGRYLSPDDDVDTVAEEFVDRLSAHVDEAAEEDGIGVLVEGMGWKDLPRLRQDQLDDLRTVTRHQNFNIKRAEKMWMDWCVDESMRQFTQDIVDRPPTPVDAPWPKPSKRQIKKECLFDWHQMIDVFNKTIREGAR